MLAQQRRGPLAAGRAQQTPGGHVVATSTSRTLQRRRMTVSNVAGGAHQQQQQQPSSSALHEQGPSSPQPGVREPPRPPELPVLGHLLPLTTHVLKGGNLEQLLAEWQRQYGSVFEFQVPGSPPVMIITEPEHIRQVFEVLNYHKSPRYADLLPILGPDSMLITEGSEWHAQRTAFNPGFSSTFLRAALAGFVDSAANLVTHVGRKADAGEVVLMHHVAILATLEIICRVGFGEKVELLLGDGEAAGRLFKSFEGIGRHVAYFLDRPALNWLKGTPWNVSKSQRLQAEYDRQLLPILIKRLAEMGISVSQQQQEALLAASLDSSSALYGGIKSSSSSSSSSSSKAAGKCPFPGVSAAAGAASPSSSDASSSGASSSGAGECPFSASATSSSGGGATDILSLAVQLARQQAADSGDASGGVDLQMLLSQMKTFFAAGHDTTASLIAWTFSFLTMPEHAAVQARLVEEILTVMGPDSEPTYEQLTQMRFLNAVLKESLRVRPPVGLLARWAPEGTSLGGFNTSSKVLLVSPMLQHMDEAAWGPDATTWRPDRWLEEGGPASRVSAYNYMPFSRGGRDCIGSKFALIEAKSIIAMLYRAFEFECASSQPEKVLISVTAHPANGVPLRVRRRRQYQKMQQQPAEVAEAAVVDAASR